MEITDNYYTATQLAQMCGVSRQRIWQMIREKKIKPNVNTGVIYLFSKKNSEEIRKKFYRVEEPTTPNAPNNPEAQDLI